MSSLNRSPLNIYVAGDVTLDWNLALTRTGTRISDRFNPGDPAHACWQRGGAALLGDLITVIAGELEAASGRGCAVYQAGFSTQAFDPADPTLNQSYALWTRYQNKGADVWRVAEFLGVSRQLDSRAAGPSWYTATGELPPPDLLVLDDAGLGFREEAGALADWLGEQASNFWIILKMNQPVGQGPLWERLLENHSERLVVLTTVNDLRSTEIQISKGLSWERTAQDLLWELKYNPQIHALSHCAAVVVSFGVAGAVVHSRLQVDQDPGTQADCTGRLVFAPGLIEGAWEAAHPGEMIGYMTCLAGGVIRQFMRSPAAVDIIPGVQSGLEAMRGLHLEGYENAGSPTRPEIRFPLRRIAQDLTRAGNRYAVIEIQDPCRYLTGAPTATGAVDAHGYWTILHNRYQGDLEEVCTRIVLEGAETTLTDVPQGIFKGLFTVDRQEIESFRSIHALAKEYLSQARPPRPLSIGVFGAPGSGKSFGVTQVAKSLAPDRIEVREFNLSQFASPDDLRDALHQVRDLNLGGLLPLVFWDEFDTPLDGKPLGWLPYFLAPMQDGEFREGQLVRPVGPAIFVFAGGTSHRMETFGAGLDQETLKAAKVPDFVSRLKGFVNVMGPNRQDQKTGSGTGSDPFYVIRRAILLRSILWRNERQLFQQDGGQPRLNIDRGVLRAFLNTRFYKHGIRSMESIVAMSQLANQTRFERSSLPPEAQLELHVDGQEFLALVQQIELTPETQDRLAVLLHANFCAYLREQGYVYGEDTDEAAKTHSALVDFNDLPPEEQEQNRDSIRHIHAKLSANRYIMIPARSNEAACEFPPELLESLAIMEHERWVKMKLAAGWSPAGAVDKVKREHPDLVAWEELPDRAKNKDRSLVAAIPKILARAGYTVVRLRPLEAGS